MFDIRYHTFSKHSELDNMSVSGSEKGRVLFLVKQKSYITRQCIKPLVWSQHHDKHPKMAFPLWLVLTLIPTSCVLGVLFAVFLWGVVAKVHLVGGQVVRSQNGR